MDTSPGAHLRWASSPRLTQAKACGLHSGASSTQLSVGSRDGIAACTRRSRGAPRTGHETGRHLTTRLALAALRLYKTLLSPLFAGSCRYLPSCSDYMAEAVARHGAAAGTALGLRRLGRCHPLGGSGFDPVPAGRPWRALMERRPHAEPGART